MIRGWQHGLNSNTLSDLDMNFFDISVKSKRICTAHEKQTAAYGITPDAAGRNALN